MKEGIKEKEKAGNEKAKVDLKGGRRGGKKMKREGKM
jgi:hypothetical protein